MRWQYQQRGEPVSTSKETPQIDKWAPTYPVRLNRAPALIAAIVASTFIGVTDPAALTRKEAVTLDRWAPTYPDRLDRAKRAFWEGGQSPVDPLALTRKEAVTLDRWAPTYPHRLDRAKRAFWEGG